MLNQQNKLKIALIFQCNAIQYPLVSYDSLYQEIKYLNYLLVTPVTALYKCIVQRDYKRLFVESELLAAIDLLVEYLIEFCDTLMIRPTFSLCKRFHK